MRILFFSPHYGTVGGVRLIIDALAQAARTAGHRVAAVVDGDGSRFVGLAREIRPYPFPSRARELRRLRRFGGKFPRAMAGLIGAARAFAPHVVSVHCMRRFAPYAALLRGVVRVPHVLNLQEGALPPGMIENRGLFRLLVRSADAVAACSQEAAAYARRTGDARRVVVIPNGYEPEEFRAREAFSHPRRYILGLGRLEPQKGFDVLIEALARMRQTDVDVILAGEGSERRSLERLATERGVGERVRFLGATNRATSVTLLRGAAVVACPSRFEGLPLVCIEALAAVRPVVASAVNGTPEVVRDGETGLLVPPDDSAALAAALGRVLDAPESAQRLATLGHEMIQRVHSWPVITQRYLALCAELAGVSTERAAA